MNGYPCFDESNCFFRTYEHIPVDTAVGAEVSIQTFGTIDVGMLTLLGFLICTEHFFSMPALSFAYKTAIYIGGFTSG